MEIRYYFSIGYRKEEVVDGQVTDLQEETAKPTTGRGDARRETTVRPQTASIPVEKERVASGLLSVDRK